MSPKRIALIAGSAVALFFASIFFFLWVKHGLSTKPPYLRPKNAAVYLESRTASASPETESQATATPDAAAPPTSSGATGASGTNAGNAPAASARPAAPAPVTPVSAAQLSRAQAAASARPTPALEAQAAPAVDTSDTEAPEAADADASDASRVVRAKPTATVPPTGKRVDHIVRDGETLSGIAQRYGTRPRDVMRWNELHSTRIRSGQRLKLYLPKPEAEVASPSSKPSAPPVDRRGRYIVRSGDTLLGLARKHGVSVHDLMGWNDLGSSSIRIGQRLHLADPAAESTQTPVASAPSAVEDARADETLPVLDARAADVRSSASGEDARAASAGATTTSTRSTTGGDTFETLTASLIAPGADAAPPAIAPPSVTAEPIPSIGTSGTTAQVGEDTSPPESAVTRAPNAAAARTDDSFGVLVGRFATEAAARRAIRPYVAQRLAYKILSVENENRTQHEAIVGRFDDAATAEIFAEILREEYGTEETVVVRYKP